MSKLWNRPFSRVQLAISSCGHDFLSSEIQEFMATSNALCINFVCGVKGSESSMTSGCTLSNIVTISNRNLGHKYNFLTYNNLRSLSTFPSRFCSCSGSSENALMKPSLFLSLYTRRINDSMDISDIRCASSIRNPDTFVASTFPSRRSTINTLEVTK